MAIFLTVDTPYTLTDLYSVNAAFNDKRLVSAGNKLLSLVVGQTGASIDLTEIFGAQREGLTTEFDAPPDFPTKTASISVRSFDTSTGLITVADAFPLRLYEGQRISKGNQNYFVHQFPSSTTFSLKLAKVDTSPVTTGFTTGDTLVAHYELDINVGVARRFDPIYNSQLVITARPYGARYSNYSATTQYDAEWFGTVNVTTTNTYVTQNALRVNFVLTNRVV